MLNDSAEKTLEEGRMALDRLEKQLRSRVSSRPVDIASDTSSKNQSSSSYANRKLLDQLPRGARLNNRLESLGLTVEELDDRGLIEGGGSVPSYYTSLKQKNRRLLELQPRSHRLLERGKEATAKTLNAVFHMLRTHVRWGIPVQEEFMSADPQRTGLLSKKSFVAILKRIELPFRLKELNEIAMHYLDSSGNGSKVDYLLFLKEANLSNLDSNKQTTQGAVPPLSPSSRQSNNNNNYQSASSSNVLREVKRMLLSAIKSLDKNFDDLYRMFARWDTDGSGTVTATQFLRVIARLHVDISDADQDFLVELLDTQNTGRIDFESLLTFCLMPQQQHHEQQQQTIDESNETVSAISVDNNDGLTNNGSLELKSIKSNSSNHNLQTTGQPQQSKLQLLRRPLTASRLGGGSGDPFNNSGQGQGQEATAAANVLGSPETGSSYGYSNSNSNGQLQRAAVIVHQRPLTASARVTGNNNNRGQGQQQQQQLLLPVVRASSATASTPTQSAARTHVKNNQEQQPSLSAANNRDNNANSSKRKNSYSELLVLDLPDDDDDEGVDEGNLQSQEQQQQGHQTYGGNHDHNNNSRYPSPQLPPPQQKTQCYQEEQRQGNQGQQRHQQDQSEQPEYYYQYQPAAPVHYRPTAGQQREAAEGEDISPPQELCDVNNMADEPFVADNNYNNSNIMNYDYNGNEDNYYYQPPQQTMPAIISVLSIPQSSPVDHLVLLATQILDTLRDMLLARHRRGNSLPDLYRAFDSDKKGYFHAADLARVAEGLRIATSERVAQLAVSMLCLDDNSNGRVSFGEFKSFLLYSQAEHIAVVKEAQVAIAAQAERYGGGGGGGAHGYDSHLRRAILREAAIEDHGDSAMMVPRAALQRVLVLDLSHEDMNCLLTRFDLNGDDHIHLDRFLSLMTTSDRSEPWASAMERLQYVDRAAKEANQLRQQQSQQQGHPQQQQSLQEELISMCEYLGIGCLSEPYLLSIASDALRAPLPLNWTVQRDDKGRNYFFNVLTQQSRWEHPLDPYFRQQVTAQRRTGQQQGGGQGLQQALLQSQQPLPWSSNTNNSNSNSYYYSNSNQGQQPVPVSSSSPSAAAWRTATTTAVINNSNNNYNSNNSKKNSNKPNLTVATRSNNNYNAQAIINQALRGHPLSPKQHHEQSQLQAAPAHISVLKQMTASNLQPVLPVNQPAIVTRAIINHTHNSSIHSNNRPGTAPTTTNANASVPKQVIAAMPHTHGKFSSPFQFVSSGVKKGFIAEREAVVEAIYSAPASFTAAVSNNKGSSSSSHNNNKATVVARPQTAGDSNNTSNSSTMKRAKKLQSMYSEDVLDRLAATVRPPL